MRALPVPDQTDDAPAEATRAIAAAGELLARMDFVLSHGVSTPGAFEIITELSVGRQAQR